MDPVSTLGLAASVIQITHFAGQLIHGVRDGFQSVDNALSNNISLKQAARTLATLTENIAIPADSPDLSPDEKLLRDLGRECQKVSSAIIHRLRRLQDPNSVTRWVNFRQNLSQVLGQGETRALGSKLGKIREQVDTALLICLRYIRVFASLSDLSSNHVAESS
jgi:hypothetical protein